MNAEREILVRDPVCGMKFNPDDAADIEVYKEKIFYFCAPGCKKEFKRNPENYFFMQRNEENKNEKPNEL